MERDSYTGEVRINGRWYEDIDQYCEERDYYEGDNYNEDDSKN